MVCHKNQEQALVRAGIPHMESGPLVRSSYHARASREAVPVTIGAR